MSVLPNPSGLNAHWTAATMAEEFGRLRVAAEWSAGTPTVRRAPLIADLGQIGGVRHSPGSSAPKYDPANVQG